MDNRSLLILKAKELETPSGSWRSVGILRFSLSYRDVEVDHVTVWRWVQLYGPELEQRLRWRLKPTNDSWRVDETYVRVKGKWVYSYRAVDSSGATIDFVLSAKRECPTKCRSELYPSFWMRR